MKKQVLDNKTESFKKISFFLSSLSQTAISATEPATESATKPATKPATEPATKPATKSAIDSTNEAWANYKKQRQDE